LRDVAPGVVATGVDSSCQACAGCARGIETRQLMGMRTVTVEVLLGGRPPDEMALPELPQVRVGVGVAVGRLLASVPLLLMPPLLLSSQGSNLRDTEFEDSNFSNSDLSNAQFFDTELPRTNFRETHLQHASFVAANLQWAIFSNAALQGADFRGAPLSAALFENTHLDEIDLNEAVYDERYPPRKDQ
jgi:Pentapeptide repeats (9 copies)